QPSDSPRAGAARLGAYLDADAARDLGTDPSDHSASPSPRRIRSVGDTGARAPLGRKIDHDRLDAGHLALSRLARAAEQCPYAPPGSPSPEVESATVAADVVTVSATLRSVAPRSRRIGAAIAPQSVLSRVSSSLRSAMGRLPWPGHRAAAGPG